MIIKGDWTTKRVTIDGKALSPAPSQKLHNHSPDGFNWGYGGSGPAQLALAILLAHLMPQSSSVTESCEKEELAQAYYMRFKFEVIASLPQGDFKIYFDLDTWLAIKEAETQIKAALDGLRDHIAQLAQKERWPMWACTLGHLSGEIRERAGLMGSETLAMRTWL